MFWGGVQKFARYKHSIYLVNAHCRTIPGNMSGMPDFARHFAGQCRTFGENKTQTMALTEEIAAQLKSNIESGSQ
jgi:hypothetical protein